MEELSDETKAALVKQVEFYFSDENLPTDAFMKKKIKAGGAQGGWNLGDAAVVGCENKGRRTKRPRTGVFECAVRRTTGGCFD